MMKENTAVSNKKTDLYRHFDSEGMLLYIGISFHTLFRLADHRGESSWYDNIRTVTIEKFPSREAAEQAERAAIKSELPKHNEAHHPKNSKPLSEMPILVKPITDRTKLWKYKDPAVHASILDITNVRHYTGLTIANFEDWKKVNPLPKRVIGKNWNIRTIDVWIRDCQYNWKKYQKELRSRYAENN